MSMTRWAFSVATILAVAAATLRALRASTASSAGVPRAWSRSQAAR